uniref:Uncharacterized protein n=1 Tax=Onchocerca volvulus TaxID=6282 RepID=A0A8R1TRZ3_ONCVO
MMQFSYTVWPPNRLIIKLGELNLLWIVSGHRKMCRGIAQTKNTVLTYCLRELMDANRFSNPPLAVE